MPLKTVRSAYKPNAPRPIQRSLHGFNLILSFAAGTSPNKPSNVRSSSRMTNTARPAQYSAKLLTSAIPLASKTRPKPTNKAHLKPTCESLMSYDQYETFMRHVYEHGVEKSDRTGTGTRSVFGYQMRFDLRQGFPLITTKKLHTRSIFTELLWFLRGDSNIGWLNERKVTIWDEWAADNGDLGPIYGVQWRSWPAPDGRQIDQISQVIEQIKNNHDSRRLIVNSWNVGQIQDMALPPCHALFQFYVANNQLSCQLYQRSADIFLGVPFNIASYALLTHMVAQQCDLEVGDFIWTGGDCHL